MKIENNVDCKDVFFVWSHFIQSNNKREVFCDVCKLFLQLVKDAKTQFSWTNLLRKAFAQKCNNERNVKIWIEITFSHAHIRLYMEKLQTVYKRNDLKHFSYSLANKNYLSSIFQYLIQSKWPFQMSNDIIEP